MLRPLIFVLMLAAPSASAEQFRDSAIGVEVRGDNGAVIGEVAAVERNADGEIVAAEIPGLEPADAPFARPDLVAEEERDQRWIPTNARGESERGGVSARSATR